MSAGLLKVKRLHPDARLPTYATEGAACFDLYALYGGDLNGYRDERAETMRTGLAVEIPTGWAMLIFSRSGHGFNSNVRLANCVGVIDSDYRGEIQVKLTIDEYGSLTLKAGDRIAQAMLVRAEQWHIEEVDELSDTARGTGGFGSTGA